MELSREAQEELERYRTLPLADKRNYEWSEELNAYFSSTAARLGWHFLSHGGLTELHLMGEYDGEQNVGDVRCALEGLHFYSLSFGGAVTCDTIEWAMTSLHINKLSLEWENPSEEQLETVSRCLEQSPVETLDVRNRGTYESYAPSVERWHTLVKELDLLIRRGGERLVQSMLQRKLSSLRELWVAIGSNSVRLEAQEWTTAAGDLLAALVGMPALEVFILEQWNGLSPQTLRVPAMDSLKSLTLWYRGTTANGRTVSLEIGNVPHLESISVRGFNIVELPLSLLDCPCLRTASFDYHALLSPPQQLCDQF